MAFACWIFGNRDFPVCLAPGEFLRWETDEKYSTIPQPGQTLRAGHLSIAGQQNLRGGSYFLQNPRQANLSFGLLWDKAYVNWNLDSAKNLKAVITIRST